MKQISILRLILTGIYLWLPVQSNAQNIPMPWDITKCIQYAADHNFETGTLRLGEEITTQEMYAAKAARLPDLSGNISNTFTNANNAAGTNGALINQLSSSGSYSVNSSVVLWNGNYINNNIQQKILQNESAGLNIKQSINNISLLITQAYLNILLSKENLRYVTDLVNTSAAMVKQGQLFYDAGSVAKLALLQLQAQYAADNYLLVQTQNAIKQNLLTLKQLLQLPTDSLFDIITPAEISFSAAIPGLAAAQQTALSNFPEIAAGRLGIEIARLDIAKARAGFKPVLTANAAIGSGYSGIITNVRVTKDGYFTQSGNNFYQRVGVTLSIPIFSNRINKTNLELANIGYRQSGLNLENAKLSLARLVEQAWLNSVNAEAAFAASAEQLTAASESFRIITAQFKLGGTNAFELLQLRNQYVQAVQAYTQAKYTAALQLKIYRFYIGSVITF